MRVRQITILIMALHGKWLLNMRLVLERDIGVFKTVQITACLTVLVDCHTGLVLVIVSRIEYGTLVEVFLFVFFLRGYLVVLIRISRVIDSSLRELNIIIK